MIKHSYVLNDKRVDSLILSRGYTRSSFSAILGFASDYMNESLGRRHRPVSEHAIEKIAALLSVPKEALIAETIEWGATGRSKKETDKPVKDDPIETKTAEVVIDEGIEDYGDKVMIKVEMTKSDYATLRLMAEVFEKTPSQIVSELFFMEIEQNRKAMKQRHANLKTFLKRLEEES